MSSSGRDKRSRRIITVSAAIAAVTAAVAVSGCRTLAGFRDFHDACREVAKDVTTSWRINYEGQRCVVMIDPVPVDSELTDRAPPPRLLNKDEVFDALKKSFVERSAETTIEGVAIAHFLVDEKGVVRQKQIATSSGHETLDEAVLAIAPLSSFSPAKGEMGPTEAWVALTVGIRAY